MNDYRKELKQLIELFKQQLQEKDKVIEKQYKLLGECVQFNDYLIDIIKEEMNDRLGKKKRRTF